MKAAASILSAFALLLPLSVSAHTIPDDVSVQMWAKPQGRHLHLLVRVPMSAMADTVFPFREGVDLDLPQVEAMLPDAAKTWISDWLDVYEDQSRLDQPKIVETRLSLASDRSFASYDEAWAHVTGPRLPGVMEVAPNQAMVDVLFDYPVRSGRSAFAIHSRLARLGVRVVTLLQFVPANGGLVRTYGFTGDPGLFELDPQWSQAVQRFVPLGFLEILKGADYLLFLFCAALLLRRARLLVPFAAAFAAGHSVTLIASAYNLAPDALWFPVLFETLIALSIVYLALDAIVAASPSQSRWPLACAFGLIFGFGFAFALRPALQFGGSHVLTSVLAFNLGIELGLIAALTALALALNLFFRLGVPERVGTIFLAALAAHTAWHRMLDRAQWLGPAWANASQVQWPPSTPWVIAAILLAALVYAAVRYRTFAWRITPSAFSRIRRATS